MQRIDILWSINVLARAVTKWNKASDKRWERLISYLHHTNDHRQNCFVGDSATNCQLGLFQDASFVGDLQDSKSTSVGLMCMFGPSTFVPIGWMCKMQGVVSHSRAEADVISLDVGLRLGGIPTLRLWDNVLDVLYPRDPRGSDGETTRARNYLTKHQ